MLKRFLRVLSSVGIFGLMLAGCGGGGGPQVVSPTSGPITLKNTIALPNITTGGSFSYDIGAVDATKRLYYLADRTNKGVDIVNVDTQQFVATVTGGFAGVQASNDISGPDGVVIPGDGSNTIYVGDVNRVAVVDVNAKSVTQSIAIPGSGGFRTDEGCYDPDDGLVGFANPANTPPFFSWISTKTNTVVSQLQFTDSTGLEACSYDPATKSFYINNDGTTANPNGEVDVVTAASAVAKAPTVSKVYALPNCGPTGSTMGPTNQSGGNILIVGCDPSANSGSPELTYFINTVSGTTSTVAGLAGTDEIWFDPSNNRVYEAARNNYPSGTVGVGPKTATLGVIDVIARKITDTPPTGTGAHSVAVDPNTNRAFVPSAGKTGTITGGLNVYNYQNAP